MAEHDKPETGTIELPTLGDEGDSCSQCGAPLATDQRYCVNCGTRRGAARTDYERQLANGTAPAAAALNGAAIRPGRAEWSPVTVIGSIAVLGVMLLLGVLIGKDDNKTTQVAAAPTTTAATTTAATTTPTTTTPTTASKTKGKKGGGGSTGQTVAGVGKVEKGGTGKTNGIAAANTNLGSGKQYEENSKHTPDVQATQGSPAAQDPNGTPGAGSGATVIK